MRFFVPQPRFKSCAELNAWLKDRYPVEIRASVERVEFWQDGQIVGQHDRAFGRDRAISDPLHYIPVHHKFRLR